MQAFLLTWKGFAWPEYDKAARSTQEGVPLRHRWTLNAFRQAKVGDIVYLLKQGERPNGIVGRGVIRQMLGFMDDWRPGRQRFKAEVEFEMLLHLGQALDREVLPKNLRNSQSSGIRIPDEVASMLEAAWIAHLDDMGSSNPRKSLER